jgi:hypothetical protein
MKSPNTYLVIAILLCSCSSAWSSMRWGHYNKPKKRVVYKIPSKKIDFSKRLECTFKHLQDNVYAEGAIEMEGPIKDDFGDWKASIQFYENSKGLTLAPSEGLIIANDETKVVVFQCRKEFNTKEINPCWVYTIFKDSGIFIYHRVTSMIGVTPRGTTSMGYCI